ncbi:MAG: Rieske 2Fe-2S domain-containing protein [Woeseiaceae bacterium]|nr:Rieske 2Fe-2S domain-containing protein [Woeseiaceae bacterium]
MNDRNLQRVTVGRLDELDDPGCREFEIGEGDWPFRGFVVRRGNEVRAYQNYCMHVGHPLNFKPDSFLTRDESLIICASHGALYEIGSGLCVAGPCTGKRLRGVDVEIVDGLVVVEGPDSA